LIEEVAKRIKNLDDKRSIIAEELSDRESTQ